MAVIHGNEKDFNGFIQKEYALVDFYAEWCGPCKMLGPVLESIGSNRDGVEILKINVDENNDLARSLGIMSIPTLLFYHKGQLLGRTMGFMNEEALNNWIEELKNK